MPARRGAAAAAAAAKATSERDTIDRKELLRTLSGGGGGDSGPGAGESSADGEEEEEEEEDQQLTRLLQGLSQQQSSKLSSPAYSNGVGSGHEAASNHANPPTDEAAASVRSASSLISRGDIDSIDDDSAGSSGDEEVASVSGSDIGMQENADVAIRYPLSGRRSMKLTKKIGLEPDPAIVTGNDYL
eukprot:jgi/Chlat1/8618/Chrsp86S09235